MEKNLFTDWYLPEEDPVSGFVYPGPIIIRENGKLIQRALNLVDLCKEKEDVEFSVNDGIDIFRGHKINTVYGLVYSLRAIPTHVPDFSKLGLSKAIQALMLHKKLSHGGLILICGETGNGKSTTCASFIRARLERFGSFCLTLENPPEFPLHGAHGAGGMCIQTDVPSGGFGDAIRGALRCYPTQGNNMLFVGEIRDPETAGEALRIAINGHLVVSTLHGADVLSSIKRFMSLSLSYKNMSETEAKSVFSSALRLVVHQRLKEVTDGVRKLDAKILFSPNASSPVANRIRQGQIDSLTTEFQQQERLLELGQVDRLLDLWAIQDKSEK